MPEIGGEHREEHEASTFTQDVASALLPVSETYMPPPVAPPPAAAPVNSPVQPGWEGSTPGAVYEPPPAEPYYPETDPSYYQPIYEPPPVAPGSEFFQTGPQQSPGLTAGYDPYEPPPFDDTYVSNELFYALNPELAPDNPPTYEDFLASTPAYDAIVDANPALAGWLTPDPEQLEQQQQWWMAEMTNAFALGDKEKVKQLNNELTWAQRLVAGAQAGYSGALDEWIAHQGMLGNLQGEGRENSIRQVHFDPTNPYGQMGILNVDDYVRPEDMLYDLRDMPNSAGEEGGLLAEMFGTTEQEAGYLLNALGFETTDRITLSELNTSIDRAQDAPASAFRFQQAIYQGMSEEQRAVEDARARQEWIDKIGRMTASGELFSLHADTPEAQVAIERGMGLTGQFKGERPDYYNGQREGPGFYAPGQDFGGVLDLLKRAGGAVVNTPIASILEVVPMPGRGGQLAADALKHLPDDLTLARGATSVQAFLANSSLKLGAIGLPDPTLGQVLGGMWEGINYVADYTWESTRDGSIRTIHDLQRTWEARGLNLVKSYDIAVKGGEQRELEQARRERAQSVGEDWSKEHPWLDMGGRVIFDPFNAFSLSKWIIEPVTGANQALKARAIAGATKVASDAEIMRVMRENVGLGALIQDGRIEADLVRRYTDSNPSWADIYRMNQGRYSVIGDILATNGVDVAAIGPLADEFTKRVHLRFAGELRLEASNSYDARMNTIIQEETTRMRQRTAELDPTGNLERQVVLALNPGTADSIKALMAPPTVLALPPGPSPLALPPGTPEALVTPPPPTPLALPEGLPTRLGEPLKTGFVRNPQGQIVRDEKGNPLRVVIYEYDEMQKRTQQAHREWFFQEERRFYERRAAARQTLLTTSEIPPPAIPPGLAPDVHPSVIEDLKILSVRDSTSDAPVDYIRDMFDEIFPPGPTQQLAPGTMPTPPPSPADLTERLTQKVNELWDGRASLDQAAASLDVNGDVEDAMRVLRMDERGARAHLQAQGIFTPKGRMSHEQYLERFPNTVRSDDGAFYPGSPKKRIPPATLGQLDRVAKQWDAPLFDELAAIENPTYEDVQRLMNPARFQATGDQRIALQKLVSAGKLTNADVGDWGALSRQKAADLINRAQEPASGSRRIDDARAGLSPGDNITKNGIRRSEVNQEIRNIRQQQADWLNRFLPHTDAPLVEGRGPNKGTFSSIQTGAVDAGEAGQKLPLDELGFVRSRSKETGERGAYTVKAVRDGDTIDGDIPVMTPAALQLTLQENADFLMAMPDFAPFFKQIMDAPLYVKTSADKVGQLSSDTVDMAFKYAIDGIIDAAATASPSDLAAFRQIIFDAYFKSGIGETNRRALVAKAVAEMNPDEVAIELAQVNANLRRIEVQRNLRADRLRSIDRDSDEWRRLNARNSFDGRQAKLMQDRLSQLTPRAGDDAARGIEIHASTVAKQDEVINAYPAAGPRVPTNAPAGYEANRAAAQDVLIDAFKNPATRPATDAPVITVRPDRAGGESDTRLREMLQRDIDAGQMRLSQSEADLAFGQALSDDPLERGLQESFLGKLAEQYPERATQALKTAPEPTRNAIQRGLDAIKDEAARRYRDSQKMGFVHPGTSGWFRSVKPVIDFHADSLSRADWGAIAEDLSAFAKSYYSHTDILTDQRRFARLKIRGRKDDDGKRMEQFFEVSPLSLTKMSQMMLVGDHVQVDLMRMMSTAARTPDPYNYVRGHITRLITGSVDELENDPILGAFYTASEQGAETLRAWRAHGADVLEAFEHMVPHNSLGDLPHFAIPRPVNGQLSRNSMDTLHKIFTEGHRPKDLDADELEELDRFVEAFGERWVQHVYPTFYDPGIGWVHPDARGRARAAEGTLASGEQRLQEAKDAARKARKDGRTLDADLDMLTARADDAQERAAKLADRLAQQRVLGGKPSERDRLALIELRKQAREARNTVKAFQRDPRNVHNRLTQRLQQTAEETRDTVQDTRRTLTQAEKDQGLFSVLNDLDPLLFTDEVNDAVDLPLLFDRIGSYVAELEGKRIGFDFEHVPTMLKVQLGIKGNLSQLWMTVWPGYHLNNLAGNVMSQWIGAMRGDMNVPLSLRINKSWEDAAFRQGSGFSQTPTTMQVREREVLDAGRGGVARGPSEVSDPYRRGDSLFNRAAQHVPGVKQYVNATQLGAETVERHFREVNYSHEMMTSLTKGWKSVLDEFAGDDLYGPMFTGNPALSDDLMAAVGVDQVHNVLATHGAPEALVTKVLSRYRTEIAKAEWRGYQTMRTVLRDYRSRSKLDGILDRIIPVHKWTTANMAFVSKTVLDRPSTILGGMAAYQTWDAEFDGLPPSLRKGYVPVPVDWLPWVERDTYHMRIVNLTNPVLWAVPKLMDPERWDSYKDMPLRERVLHWGTDGLKNFWEVSGYRIGPQWDWAIKGANYAQQVAGKEDSATWDRWISRLNLVASPQGYHTSWLPLGGFENLPVKNRQVQRGIEWLNAKTYGKDGMYTNAENYRFALALENMHLRDPEGMPYEQYLAALQALKAGDYDNNFVRTAVDQVLSTSANTYVIARFGFPGQSYDNTTWEMTYETNEQYQAMLEASKSYEVAEHAFAPGSRPPVLVYLHGEMKAGRLTYEQVKDALGKAANGQTSNIIEAALKETESDYWQVKNDLDLFERMMRMTDAYEEMAIEHGQDVANDHFLGTWNNVTKRREGGAAPWLLAHWAVNDTTQELADRLKRIENEPLATQAMAATRLARDERYAASLANRDLYERLDRITGDFDATVKRVMEKHNGNQVLLLDAEEDKDFEMQLLYAEADRRGVVLRGSGAIPKTGQLQYSRSPHQQQLIEANDAGAAVDTYEHQVAVKGYLMDVISERLGVSKYIVGDGGMEVNAAGQTLHPQERNPEFWREDGSFDTVKFNRAVEAAAAQAPAMAQNIIRELQEHGYEIPFVTLSAGDFTAHVSEQVSAIDKIQDRKSADRDNIRIRAGSDGWDSDIVQGMMQRYQQDWGEPYIATSIREKPQFEQPAPGEPSNRDHYRYNETARLIQEFYFTLKPGEQDRFRADYPSLFNSEGKIDANGATSEVLGQIKDALGLRLGINAPDRVSPRADRHATSVNKLAWERGRVEENQSVWDFRQEVSTGSFLSQEEQENRAAWFAFLDKHEREEQVAKQFYDQVKAELGYFPKWSTVAEIARENNLGPLADYLDARVIHYDEWGMKDIYAKTDEFVTNDPRFIVTAADDPDWAARYLDPTLSGGGGSSKNSGSSSGGSDSAPRYSNNSGGGGSSTSRPPARPPWSGGGGGSAPSSGYSGGSESGTSADGDFTRRVFGLDPVLSSGSGADSEQRRAVASQVVSRLQELLAGVYLSPSPMAAQMARQLEAMMLQSIMEFFGPNPTLDDWLELLEMFSLKSDDGTSDRRPPRPPFDEPQVNNPPVAQTS